MKKYGTFYRTFILGISLGATVSCGSNFGDLLSAKDAAAITIGAPSSTLIQSGTVTYLVTYPTDTDENSIALDASSVTIGGTDKTDCVASVTGSGLTRSVDVDLCSGTGTVNISIVAGTAKSTTGTSLGAAGPSNNFAVDNTGPLAASVNLGTVPNNITNTPTITYSPVQDVGAAGVDGYEVRIIKNSDSSVVQNWTTHVSGNDVVVSLESNTAYSAFIRATDSLGNIGAASTAAIWTTATVAPPPCGANPSPGDPCTGGVIYMGSLSPGATSGSGTDHYMTTPGGCGEIPAGQRVGAAGPLAYPNADFTPTCSGTDALEKSWAGNDADVHAAGLETYATAEGTTNGAINTDLNYGDTNTTNLVAITDPLLGGYHAAARYCDSLSYGGYTDWYLPNRYELNLMYVNRASIQGLDTSGSWYLSSSEFSNSGAWDQRFSDGYQLRNGLNKTFNELVRCVRRFR